MLVFLTYDHITLISCRLGPQNAYFLVLVLIIKVISVFIHLVDYTLQTPSPLMRVSFLMSLSSYPTQIILLLPPPPLTIFHGPTFSIPSYPSSTTTPDQSSQSSSSSMGSPSSNSHPSPSSIAQNIHPAPTQSITINPQPQKHS